MTSPQPAEAEAARQRGRKLAHLRYHWDDWYDIGWCDVFTASRKDGSGATLRASTDAGLHQAIIADYTTWQPLRPGGWA